MDVIVYSQYIAVSSISAKSLFIVSIPNHERSLRCTTIT